MTKFLNISTDTTLGGNAPSDELAVSQKAIKTYVDSHSGGGSVAIDNTTITKNSSDEIQAIAVIDQNSGIAKTWTGTQAEYEAIVTKDPETEYIITDDIGLPATEIGEITEALNNKVDKGHQVVEFQEPTAANNYTWYRKYADGWVEQGGRNINWPNPQSSGTANVTFPIPMRVNGNTSEYTLVGAIHPGNATATYEHFNFSGRTSTGFSFTIYDGYSGSWACFGMAA